MNETNNNQEFKKTKPIQKKSLSKIHLSALKPFSSRNQILQGEINAYEVCQTIQIRPSKKGKVCLLKNIQTGVEFVGKFIIDQKQHQVIFQCFFLNKLKSDSICKFVELIRNKEGYWIVMEKGKSTLLDYLAQMRPQEIPTILKNISEAYSIFYQLKISHRDLKLSNIVIENDEKKTIKFIDLQLCQKNNHVYGTKDFLPPEIKRIDWSVCDSYAFGLIAKKLCDYCGWQNKQIKELIDGCTKFNLSERWNWKNIFDFFQIVPSNNDQTGKLNSKKHPYYLQPKLEQNKK